MVDDATGRCRGRRYSVHVHAGGVATKASTSIIGTYVYMWVCVSRPGHPTNGPVHPVTELGRRYMLRPLSSLFIQMSINAVFYIEVTGDIVTVTFSDVAMIESSRTSTAAAYVLCIYNIFAIVLCLLTFSLGLWMMSSPHSLVTAAQYTGSSTVKV
ncbi:hypothetical protein EVAR_70072_1 [Eumeta japonica]|uniref:Uncharacterized protein n=1 Tax=Eumeta variegata TaxID=151549 RepID=A0A4C1ZY87_EUMVA|nr:hypothetical protein EVAR_70072_1 [Eumeta japonica]